MNTWTTREREDYLAGQVHALTAMVQALLITHPNPQLAREVFEHQLLKTEANTLPTKLSDAHLKGLRAVQALLYADGANPAAK
jgi:hypothetical protein